MWQIAGISIADGAVLAPMAGVTDSIYRQICKEQGCALVYGELVSAKAIHYRNDRTLELLRFEQAERPIGLQLFGSEPEIMAAAAAYVATVNPDFIDINMGCPTPKIVANGDGAALLRNPQLAAEVAAAVVAAVRLPVTVKMRSGWDAESINAVKVATMLEAAGVKALAVHGRTREQFYGGKADWQIIKQVREAVAIPVIGNGDVRCAADADRMLAETGCTAVMIGRAALGNPWIFAEVGAGRHAGMRGNEPTPTARVAMAISHLRKAVEAKGEHALYEMRKHLAWYIKGLPGSHQVKVEIMSAATSAAALDILHRYEALMGCNC